MRVWQFFSDGYYVIVVSIADEYLIIAIIEIFLDGYIDSPFESLEIFSDGQSDGLVYYIVYNNENMKNMRVRRPENIFRRLYRIESQK